MQGQPSALGRGGILVPLLIFILFSGPRKFREKETRVWWICYLIACLATVGMMTAGTNYPLAWACGVVVAGGLGALNPSILSAFLKRRSEVD
ncbi:MAG: hypothetical protein V4671_10880 [Armatimonadota bacterium]